MNRSMSLVFTAVALTIGLTSCSGDQQATLKQLCIDQVAEKAGVDTADVFVDHEAKNPAGSLDWKGTYPGGAFACAGAMDSDDLFQVLTFDD